MNRKRNHKTKVIEGGRGRGRGGGERRKKRCI